MGPAAEQGRLLTGKYGGVADRGKEKECPMGDHIRPSVLESPTHSG
jgi:hypothetical protein